MLTYAKYAALCVTSQALKSLLLYNFLFIRGKVNSALRNHWNRKKAVLRDSLLYYLFAVGIAWKPPFANSLTLLVQLLDAPKRREGENTKQCRYGHILDKQRADGGGYAYGQE